MTTGLKIAMAAFFLFMLTLLIPGMLGTLLSFAAGTVGIGGILVHNAKRAKLWAFRPLWAGRGMTSRQRTWGLIRYVYLGAGLLAAVATIDSFIRPDEISPFLFLVVAALLVGVAVLATDEWLQQIHRIWWHRQWPK